MKDRKRVVVTGMGIVSCFGNEVPAFYEALLAGKSGMQLIEKFPCPDYPTRFAADIRNFDPGDYINKKDARRIDPFIAYAMVAGKKALEMGGLTGEAFQKLDRERCGVIIGSGMGGLEMLSEAIETLLTKSHRRISPFFIPYIITNMAGALLAIDLGFMGPNYSVSTACATGNYSIHNAAKHIREGDADLMLCGGTEAPITPVGLAGFIACKALSERNDNPQAACRPFDKERDGFVMGEGAGVLLLESLEHARARGATIFGEYLGGAVSCDASHITSPREDGAGMILSMEGALQDAGLPREAIDHINAHATATSMGDLCELEAIRKTFGPHLRQVAITATKSLTGHCMGAAGGIEAIACLMAMRTGLIHPILNLDNPEEILSEFGAVPTQPLKWQVQVAMSNSFGFGGHNSSVILGRAPPA
jgi:3-oxoacyl-[acyl-carrier-protein] synthase II